MQIAYHKRIFGLDLMRAVAILFVVFSHALWIDPEAAGLGKEVLSLMGVLGVEIFFVLSGFLIGRILLKRYLNHYTLGKAMRYFWIRRWFRTLPNYYLILLVNCAITLYVGRDLPASLWKYFLFLQNAATRMDIFFVESWSLPIEEFTYILAPLLLMGISIRVKSLNRSKLFLWSALFMIFLGLLTKLGYHLWVSKPDMIFWNENLKVVTIYRLDAIFYGFLGAYLAYKLPKLWKQWQWVAALCGAFIILFLNFGIPYFGWFIEGATAFWNVLYLPINSAAILLFLPLLSSWQKAPRLLRVPVTYISVLSYAMYLLHYSVVLQLLKFYFPTDALSPIDKLVYLVAYLLLTCIASLLLYVFYERPMTNLRDSAMITSKYKPESITNSTFY